MAARTGDDMFERTQPLPRIREAGTITDDRDRFIIVRALLDPARDLRDIGPDLRIANRNRNAVRNFVLCIYVEHLEH